MAEQAPWETTASGETAPWHSAAPVSEAEQSAAEGDPSDPYSGASVGASEGMASLASSVPATIAGGAAYLGRAGMNALHLGSGEDPLDTAHRVSDKFTYAPRTKGGEAAIESAGKVMALPGKGVQAAADVVDPSTNLGQTIRNVGERAMFATAPITAAVGGAEALGRVGMRDAGTISNFGKADAQVPKNTPGPVTPAELQAGPQRLPDAPGAPPAAASTKPKITMKASDATAQDAARRQGITPAPAPATLTAGVRDADLHPAPSKLPPEEDQPWYGRPFEDMQLDPAAWNARSKYNNAKDAEAATEQERQLRVEAARHQSVAGGTMSEISQKLQAFDAELAARRNGGQPQPAPTSRPAPAAPPKPLQAPPKDEAEVAAGPGAAPDEAAQKGRLAAVEQLRSDTGSTLPNIRKSSVTGDYRETGTDYQLGELGETNMRTQLDQENNALKTASQQQVDNSGGKAKGTGATALDQRGTVIDRAVQGIGDWFDKNIKGMYAKADAAAGQKPITNFNNLHQLLADHSQFTGAEGAQLHGDIQKVAKQFGMVGDDGFWKPTTVATTEKFRQWVGEQYSPRTGRAISRVKDALDNDVAAHGGAGLYDEARATRYKRDQMLAGTKGIEKLAPVKNPDGSVYSRPVELGKMADHVANLPKEQFDHVINVLHDSSKLGDGELAKNNADAINEIRRHMAERLHEAGTGQKDGFWDSHAYHDQLDDYSTKLPGLFSPEGVRRFNTIHDAGNALRVNKRYPGAAKQLMQAGGMSALARKNIASAAEDLTLGWLGPAKGLVAGALGISGKVREGIEARLPGGNVEKRNAAMAADRVQPLGQTAFGGRQGGWVGNKPASAPRLPEERPVTSDQITHADHKDGNHTYTSPHGVADVQETADGNRKMINARVWHTVSRSKGEGSEMMASAARDTFKAGGNRLHGDVSMTDGAVGAMQKAATKYPNEMTFERNPGMQKVTHEDGTGGWVSDDPRRPVASLVKKEPQTDTRPLGQRIGGGNQRGGPKMSDFSPATKESILAKGRDAQASIPADKDDRAYGGNWKTHRNLLEKSGLSRNEAIDALGDAGIVSYKSSLQRDTPRTAPAAEATATEPATLNVGLHQGTEGQPGFRKMSKQAAQKAVESTGAKVTKNTVIMPGKAESPNLHEPTSVMSLDRQLTPEEMQSVLAKTKQSAIPQRTDAGEGSIHVAPGHEATAAKEGWDKYSDDYFHQHDGHNQTQHNGQQAAYDAIKPHLTASEQANLEDRMPQHRWNAINDLVDVFHNSTSVLGTAAMALAGAAKKGWYRNSAKAIHTVYGPDAPRFTALLAAMSPQTSVQMNFHNALHTFKAWDEAGRPKDQAAIRKIMESNSLKNPESKSKSNVMEAWLQNGVRALTSENPEHENFQLSGPKVHSFYQNLRDNVHEVTNDSWNAMAMNVDQTRFGGRETPKEDDPYGKVGGKSSAYMGVSAKVRATSDYLSKETGETWTPHETQETVWSFTKTAMEYNKDAAKAARAAGKPVPAEKTVPQLIHEGLINDDLIRSTPDFASLFSDPTHAAALAKSKHAAGARELASQQGQGPEPAAPSEKSTALAGALRPHLLAEAERLEGVRQQRIADKAANKQSRIGNIKVPF